MEIPKSVGGWAISKVGEEWIAENGNGITVHADHPMKLVIWINGGSTKDFVSSQCEKIEDEPEM